MVIAATALVGCGEPDPEIYATTEQASTVESHVANGCSTAVVIELSRQIAQEVDCMMPGQLVGFEETDSITFTGAAVLPYLSEEARTDLLAAAAEGGTIQINSGYRSVAQQYLLRRWFEAGRCGITAAAQPGQSNHESGRAIDVANWEQRRAALEAHGWAQTVPGDEVHFDHLASPDIRGSDVHAFQRLWNRNHPADLINEDGEWGAMTASRMAMAPAEGFAIGATCLDDGGDDGGDDPSLPGGGDVSGDPDDGGDPDGLVGGCATGGGSPGGILLILGVLLSVRAGRRR